MLRHWRDLPDCMKTQEVYPYYEALRKKKVSLFLKRVFDICVAIISLIVLSPLILIISVWIKLDSKGPVFYRQERVTQYGRVFKIFKFRTMVDNADKIGSQVTLNNDSRITKVGSKLRKLRLDEIPQLLNIIIGDMTFCGTRPESKYYVSCYTKEMYATLLLRAGVTSIASIKYKDEDRLLRDAENADDVYVNQILPEKMKYNLDSIKNYSFFSDIATMFNTVIEVLK